MTSRAPPTVLFDLDGTLIDSVHDLAWTANELRRRRGLPPLPTTAIREVVTLGTHAMLEQALGAEAADDEPTRDEFLDTYQLGCTRTNKRERFTRPLLEHLGLAGRTRCIVCGDSTPRPKPDPAPLHLAAALCNTTPESCLYVGDAHSDVQAARAAGMVSVIALFGYIPRDENPTHWGADHAVAAPEELVALLGIET